jgi:predicted metalloprotease with PDZ domain
MNNKTFFITIFCLLFFINCKGVVSNENTLIIQMELVDNNLLHVSYFFPTLVDHDAVFLFPQTLEGTRQIVKTSQINDFKVYCTDTTLTFYPKDTIKITNRAFNKITYSVKLDSIDSHISYFLNTFATDDLLVINPVSFCGYIIDYKNFKHVVQIGNIDNYLGENKGQTLIYNFSNYGDFINSPFYYSKNFSQVDTIIDSSKITLNVKSEFRTVPLNDIVEITTPVIQIALAELKNIGITIPEYTINVIFNDIVVSSMGIRALERRDQTLIVFYAEPYFYNRNDSVNFVFDLQNVLLHEMLHLFMPLSFKDSLLASFNHNDFVMSGHLWLYEGLITYQSYKLLTNNNLISTRTFLDEVEKMIASYMGAEKSGRRVPLYKSSIKAYERPDLHQFFYNRSAVLCFYADLWIAKKSNGTKNLWTILSDIYQTTPVFCPDSLNHYLVQHTFPEFKNFLDTYIIGDSYLNPKIFEQFGLLYSLVIPTTTDKYIPIHISSFENGVLNVVIRDHGMPPSPTDKSLVLTKINNLPISTFSLNSICRRRIPKDYISVEAIRNGVRRNESLRLFSVTHPNRPTYPNIVIENNTLFNKYFNF